MGRVLEEKEENLSPQVPVTKLDDGGDHQQLMKFPRTFSLAHLLDMDYLGPISQLIGDNSCHSSFDFQGTISNATDPPGMEFFQLPCQYNESNKFQIINQNHIPNQPLFVNQVFELQ